VGHIKGANFHLQWLCCSKISTSWTAMVITSHEKVISASLCQELAFLEPCVDNDKSLWKILWTLSNDIPTYADSPEYSFIGHSTQYCTHTQFFIIGQSWWSPTAQIIMENFMPLINLHFLHCQFNMHFFKHSYYLWRMSM
jgi:hypothetical protein